MAQYSQIAPATLQNVWQHFIFKIDNPQHFVPGVSNVFIKERTTEFVIRQMDLQLPNNEVCTVLEKITFTPYKVRYEILEHPIYSGYVDNEAEYVSDNETKITYSLHWVNKKTQEIYTNENIIKAAVIKTIDYIANH